MKEKARIRREWIIQLVGDIIEEESGELADRVTNRVGKAIFGDGWDTPTSDWDPPGEETDPPEES